MRKTAVVDPFLVTDPRILYVYSVSSNVLHYSLLETMALTNMKHKLVEDTQGDDVPEV